MDSEKIQLGEKRYVNALNVDLHKKEYLEVNQKNLIEYDIRSVLDVAQYFDGERQYVDNFRIYGELEYFSILNGTITGYTSVNDFFNPLATGVTKSILTDFQFYLLKPSTGYTGIITGSTGGTYVKNYTVISRLNEFEIYKAGYDVNLFNEQRYAFNFNNNYDVKDEIDGLSFPFTELYLYAVYQKQENGNSNSEWMERKDYNTTGGTVATGFTASTEYVTGDTIIGDFILYDKDNFTATTINRQEYYIYTPYSGTSLRLKWKYYPIIPIRIKYLSNDLERLNTGGTSYEEIQKVPSYAVSIDNDGNVVWRNLLEKGFIDPLTGEGINYPFVNQIHYVFNHIKIPIKPDLSDANTLSIFSEIKFADNELIRVKPSDNTNLDDIGKLCQT